jgi:hypothetical protein
MKIRTGFVSNSSSSSFVMLGAKVGDFRKNISEDKMIELMDKYEVSYTPDSVEDDFNDALYNERFGGLIYLWSEEALGYQLASDSDYMLDYTETSIEDLKIKAEEIQKVIKEIFDRDVDVKLITGQYAC